MNTEIQSIHFDADKKLIELINKKMNKLETIYHRIVDAQIYLKLDQEGSHIKNKIAEIKLNIPGTTLFAKEQSKTFEISVGLATESIRRQLKKYKGKR